MLRWERDQNTETLKAFDAAALPQCSGGSEIKTDRTIPGWVLPGYHNAPVGARSKRGQLEVHANLAVTTMLRWERDQNVTASVVGPKTRLPQCSGGSEIKTDNEDTMHAYMGYHNAPVGARSKPCTTQSRSVSTVTTMLRWERDQNRHPGPDDSGGRLPQCSGGSEIKTRAGTDPPATASYHNAPVGARSKQMG